VARNSAIAPSGTTFSTPVNAVPPGVTVVGETSSGEVGVIVVGLTVSVSVVVVSVSVVDVVELPGVVDDVVSVDVVCVDVVSVDVVPVVVVPVVVVPVVVVPVVVVPVVVVVVVVEGTQPEIVTSGVGFEASLSSHTQVTNAVMFAGRLAVTNSSQWPPCGDMVKVPNPLIWRTGLPTTSLSWFPKPVKIQWDVPLHGKLLDPFPVQGVLTFSLANAAPGKMAQAIIRSVAAERAIRPAVVSRLPCLLVRCAGILYLPTRVVASDNQRESYPSDGDTRHSSGLLHRSKVSVFP
jgi:hypothetical protein